MPEYKQKMGMLKEQGVELVACISVNDAWVLRLHELLLHSFMCTCSWRLWLVARIA